MKHPVLWYLSAKSKWCLLSHSSSQSKSDFDRLWHLSQCAFFGVRHFRIFPLFLVTIERLGTSNGNKCSLQAAQARSEHWALNQCSEQQLPAFVIQSKRNKRLLPVFEHIIILKARQTVRLARAIFFWLCVCQECKRRESGGENEKNKE